MGELQGEHYEKDPAKFFVATGGRRSQVRVVFEWSADGCGAPERVDCRCDTATQRGVPKPQVLLTRGQREQLEAAAESAEREAWAQELGLRCQYLHGPFSRRRLSGLCAGVRM